MVDHERLILRTTHAHDFRETTNTQKRSHTWCGRPGMQPAWIPGIDFPKHTPAVPEDKYNGI